MRLGRVAVGFLVAFSGCEKLLGPEEAVTPVGDAPKQNRARRLTLTGGKLLLEQGGKYDRVCTSAAPTSKGASPCVDHHFYVFPVVPEGWTPAQPVPAWVSCSAQSGGTTGGPTDFEACRAAMAALRGDLAGVVLIRLGNDTRFPRAESGWHKAAQDAATRFGLSIARDGPVIGPAGSLQNPSR